MSLGEMLMKPTTMLYRNLLAMETEEVLRCHPIDAAVLLGGCDKTVPALIMGAISSNIPSIFFPAGPMLKAVGKIRLSGVVPMHGSTGLKSVLGICAMEIGLILRIALPDPPGLA